MTGTDTPEDVLSDPSPPRCTHRVNNGQGIVWHCCLPPHPARDGHYMVADELAARRRAAQ